MPHQEERERPSELEQRLIQLADRMESAMNATEDGSDDTGKENTLVLDTGANPSYIKTGMPIPTKLTIVIQVTTPNGKFRTNREARITVKTPSKEIKAKSLVHNKLPANLLSVTTILERLGVLLLANEGAALLLRKAYRSIKNELEYFWKRYNKLYHVPVANGLIRLGRRTKPPK